MERRHDNVKEFGRRVRAARDRADWSQEELAGRAGLTPVQISRVERGVREVRLTTILKLVAALDVQPDELLAGIDPF